MKQFTYSWSYPELGPQLQMVDIWIQPKPLCLLKTLIYQTKATSAGSPYAPKRLIYITQRMWFYDETFNLTGRGEVLLNAGKAENKLFTLVALSHPVMVVFCQIKTLLSLELKDSQRNDAIVTIFFLTLINDWNNQIKINKWATAPTAFWAICYWSEEGFLNILNVGIWNFMTDSRYCFDLDSKGYN